MKGQVEVIDPAFAKQALEQNPRNRPLRQDWVWRLAYDMKNGLWENNGQSVVFDPAGNMLDGQHRMAAVVLSQTSVAMFVVRGVDPEAFKTMDTGKARSLADVLAMEGHKYAPVIASAARLAYNYISGVRMDGGHTKATLEAFVAAHPYLVDAAALVSDKPGSSRFAKGPLAAVLFLGNDGRAFDTEAAEFVDGVYTGQGLFRGDARHTLREWVSSAVASKRTRVTTATSFAAMAKSWNAYAAGKELLVLKALDAPSSRSLQLFGYDRKRYPEVPDLIEAQKASAAKVLERVRGLRAAAQAQAPQ